MGRNHAGVIKACPHLAEKLNMASVVMEIRLYCWVVDVRVDVVKGAREALRTVSNVALAVERARGQGAITDV